MADDIMDKMFDRIHEQTIAFIKRSKTCSQKPTSESIARARSVVSSIRLQADGIKKRMDARCSV